MPHPDLAVAPVPSLRLARIVMLLVLAVPQVLTGAWAVLAPRSFYDDFPGIGPALVGRDGPFNAHLVTDAGAGFLAIGACVAIAALLGGRGRCRLALVTYLVLESPHATFHLLHRADGLSGPGELLGIGGVLSGVAVAVALLWWLRPTVATGHPGEAPTAPGPRTTDERADELIPTQ